MFLFVNGKYRTYDLDMRLVDYLDFEDNFEILVQKHINYLVLDDLEIMDIREFSDNNYEKYILLFGVHKVMNQIRKQLSKYY